MNPDFHQLFSLSLTDINLMSIMIGLILGEMNSFTKYGRMRSFIIIIGYLLSVIVFYWGKSKGYWS